MAPEGVHGVPDASPDTAELSSSMVKGLIGPEGWESQVSRYVPHNVFAMLKEKYREVFPRS